MKLEIMAGSESHLQQKKKKYPAGTPWVAVYFVEGTFDIKNRTYTYRTAGNWFYELTLACTGGSVF